MRHRARSALVILFKFQKEQHYVLFRAVNFAKRIIRKFFAEIYQFFGRDARLGIKLYDGIGNGGRIRYAERRIFLVELVIGESDTEKSGNHRYEELAHIRLELFFGLQRISDGAVVCKRFPVYDAVGAVVAGKGEYHGSRDQRRYQQRRHHGQQYSSELPFFHTRTLYHTRPNKYNSPIVFVL